MAEIPRLQSGRVQVQGVSNLPQPNMNFGQRQPQVEFQAAAENTSTLSRTLSNLSSQMFGMAQNMAEDAGARFVAENPTRIEDLEAAANGNIEKFKRDFSLNAFGASVNKFKATELSAYLESQIVNDANTEQIKIETGKDTQGNNYDVNVAKLSADWKSKVDGYAGALAAISPDASYKLRATAAVHGNRLLLAAAKAQNQKAFAQAKVYIVKDVSDHVNSVANIIKGQRITDPKTQQVLSLQESILYERTRLLNNALARGGIDGMKFAQEQSEKVEFDVKTTVLSNAMISRKGEMGGDLVSFSERVRTKTLPADLQAVWDSMNILEQKEAKKLIIDQYQQMIDMKSKDNQIDKIEKNVEANRLMLEFLDPMRTQEERDSILEKLRGISYKHPDVVSATTIFELPKKLKEDVEDDYIEVAKLADRLRKQDPTKPEIKSVEEVVRIAAGKMSLKTAHTLAEKYLPKDAGEKMRLGNLIELEYLIRTKKADKQTGKIINSIDALNNSLKARKLTLADVPSDFPGLLQKAAEPDTSLKTEGMLLNAITNNEITEPLQVLDFIQKNRLIVDEETAKKLMYRVEEKQRQFQNDISNDAKDMARQYGTSPRSQAKLEFKYEKEIPDEINRLVQEWQEGGRKGPRPGRKEAVDSLVKKQDASISQRRIVSSNEAINKVLSDNGLTFANIASRSGDIFTTNSGPVIVIRPEYQEHLRKELGKKIKSPSALDSTVNNIMQNLIIIEQEQRNMRP